LKAAWLTHAVQIGIDDRTPALGFEVSCGHRELATGVVHDAVQVAMLLDQSCDGGVNGLLVSNVEGDPLGVSAGVMNLGDDLLQRLLAASRDHDGGTERREFVSDTAP